MALIDFIIKNTERDSVQVKSVEGSRLTGTIEENKNVFDKFPQLIMDKFNLLVTGLSALNLDTIVEDLANRYTKTEVNKKVEDATKGMITSIYLNDIPVETTNGRADIYFSVTGGDMSDFATKAYVDALMFVDSATEV
jgi:hypothetical protein